MSIVSPPSSLAMNEVKASYQRTMEEISIPHFSLQQGEQRALLGESGSGKSSLLHLISGLLPAQTGSIRLNSHELVGLKESKRDALRRHHIGIIYQTYQLLDQFTALENVMMGAYFSEAGSAHQEEAISILSAVGLGRYTEKYPQELSVGQRQRVAIARALVKKPTLILADEPTGALDASTGSTICELLQRLAAEQESALLFVTHDQSLAKRFPEKSEIADYLHWSKRRSTS